MQRNPFEILGLRENCTQAELHDAYVQLKGKYLKDRFKEGNEGAEAARQLEIIEQAYSDALEILSNKFTINNDGGSGNIFSNVEAAIRANEIDKAQNMLDSVVERGAEWHYYQSVIFYKKNWMMESRKQLQLAISLDPGNEKYIGTLNRLEEHMRSKNPFSNFKEDNAGKGDFSRSYQEPNFKARSNEDACCNTCQSLICADCCCECMGGDLISCC